MFVAKKCSPFFDMNIHLLHAEHEKRKFSLKLTHVCAEKNDDKK
jgi:hypothetical protein